MRGWIIVLCWCLAPLVAWGQGTVEPKQLQYDFGSVALDYTIYHSYYLRNVGDVPARIDSAHIGCDCSSIQYVDSVIAPGDSAMLRLSFETTNFYGPNNKSFTVFTSDSLRPALTFRYLALVEQWPSLLKPRPVGLIFLPPHKRKELTIGNVEYNHIVVEVDDQADSFFKVNVLKNKARRKERVVIEVVPDPDLGPGTHLSNFRLKVTPSDMAPVYLTVPVRIARY